MKKIIFKKTKLLEVLENMWKEALSKVEKDDKVGILHAELSGDSGNRIHVAEIPVQVGAHVHFSGDEDYLVVSGKGLLHYGEVDKNNRDVFWKKPLKVEKGSNFIIPEGFAHQLQKTGEENLIILFSCPDSHLNDDLDRLMLEDSLFLK